VNRFNEAFQNFHNKQLGQKVEPPPQEKYANYM